MQATGFLALHHPEVQRVLRQKFRDPSLLDQFKLTPSELQRVQQAVPLGTAWEPVPPSMTRHLRGEVPSDGNDDNDDNDDDHSDDDDDDHDDDDEDDDDDDDDDDDGDDDDDDDDDDDEDDDEWW